MGGGGGPGGLIPQILVGIMCRGKVKNGGLRIELERENAGLRSELGSSSVKMRVSGTDCISLYRTRQAGILAGRYSPGAPRQSEKRGAPERVRA